MGKETRARRNPHDETTYPALVRLPDARADEEVPSLRIETAEDRQRFGVEPIGADLAFHDVDLAPFPDHEVHLTARFVAPIEEPLSSRRRPQDVEDEVLPEDTAVRVAYLVPTADEADKSRVEPIGLGPPHELTAPPSVKRGQGVERAGDGEGLEMCLHRGAAEVALVRERGVIDQPPALAQHDPQQVEEPRTFPDPEELLDVSRIEAVHPLREERVVDRAAQEELGQTPMPEPSIEVPHAEGLAFGPQHGRQQEYGLAAGQRVAELAGRGERGRAGGQDAKPRESVGSDLERPAGVAQPVHLIQDKQTARRLRAVEKLRILQPPANRRQVAVQVDRVGEHPSQGCLARTAHARQPDDRAPPPGRADAVEPIRSVHHGALLYTWTTKCQSRLQYVWDQYLKVPGGPPRPSGQDGRNATPGYDRIDGS